MQNKWRDIIIWVVCFAAATVAAVCLKGLIWLVWLAVLVAGVMLLVSRVNQEKLEGLESLLSGDIGNAEVKRAIRDLNSVHFIPENKPELGERLRRAYERVSQAPGVSEENKAAFQFAVRSKGLDV